ncbi:MAG TPA: hypothetical protein VLG50_03700 [Candidatus Saccharimonadales bacterium]|nr:hypothetical protein [Candidatus Saccharimonadales bacterium]
MSDGVLYKANASTWSKSVSKKFGSNWVDDGVVKHANASTWFKNYPMEQEYEQYFSSTWSKAYQSAGIPLDTGVWGDQLWSGGSQMQGKTLIGFDKNAINNFVAAGQLLDIQIIINLEPYTHNGNGTAYFAPHQYTAQPSHFDWVNINQNYITSKTFIKGAWGGYWIDLPNTVYTAMNASMGGICIYSNDNSDVNSLQFTGRSGYNTQLYVRVLK